MPRLARAAWRITRLLAGLALGGGLIYGLAVATARPAPHSPADPTFVVADVRYTLAPGDHRTIAAVTFALSTADALPPTTVVQARVGSGGSYVACANTPAGGTTWTCPFSGVAVVAADRLAVRLSQLPAPLTPRLWLPIIPDHQSGYLPIITR